MSSLSNKVDVLVVGAGPCGLLAALEMARAGLEVEIIDRAWRSASESYACGLHGSTLALLDRLGLGPAVHDAGLAVDTLAFYEGRERRAEARLSALGGRGCGLMVLPQDRLEEILEEQLRELGVRVRWGHRLDRLTQDENAVTAVVEQLGLTSVGYPYARSEEAVEREIEVRARYLVGADGAMSHVRQVLGIPMQETAAPTAFEVVEFEPAADAGKEVRIALGAATADAFWPQPGFVCRWSLQVPSTGDGGHTPTPSEGPPGGERERVARLVRERAPWFDAGVRDLEWAATVEFGSAMAERFGVGRCWLAGDAAHQTSPVGMQSMNVGLREASDLAHRLQRVLREAAPAALLDEYDAARRAEWRCLLGKAGGLKAGPTAHAWLVAQRQRLLPLLPASGDDLAALAGQLGMQLSTT